MSNYILEIKNLSKSYGKFEAVKDISLQVEKGEVFGFLGPNGAGKTTTIKTCTGTLKPTKGQVLIQGYDITENPEAAKAALGYVPDNPYLYEKMTGREFAFFVGRLYGVSPALLDKRVEDFFELFEMRDEKEKLMQGYSRGMKQKTALIAALIHQPDILFVDEPTANLDPKSARIVKDIFESYKKQGRSVFMSTHVMEIAQHLCRRIAIIYQGELKALGTMEELNEFRAGISLEDIFLEVTGANDIETKEMIKELSGERIQ